MLLRDPIEEMREQLAESMRKMVPLNRKEMETMQQEYREASNPKVKKMYRQRIAKQAKSIEELERLLNDATFEK
jgi:hypothetical protein